MLVSFVIREVEVLTFLMQSRFEWKNTPIGDTDYITLTVDRSMERSNRQWTERNELPLKMDGSRRLYQDLKVHSGWRNKFVYFLHQG